MGSMEPSKSPAEYTTIAIWGGYNVTYPASHRATPHYSSRLGLAFPESLAFSDNLYQRIIFDLDEPLEGGDYILEVDWFPEIPVIGAAVEWLLGFPQVSTALMWPKIDATSIVQKKWDGESLNGFGMHRPSTIRFGFPLLNVLPTFDHSYFHLSRGLSLDCANKLVGDAHLAQARLKRLVKKDPCPFAGPFVGAKLDCANHVHQPLDIAGKANVVDRRDSMHEPGPPMLLRPRKRSPLRTSAQHIISTREQMQPSAVASAPDPKPDQSLTVHCQNQYDPDE